MRFPTRLPPRAHLSPPPPPSFFSFPSLFALICRPFPISPYLKFIMLGSVSAASLAFLLETFNMLHNVEGRLVLLNTQLLFWLNASLFAGLGWFAALNQYARAERTMPWRERVFWVVLVGFLGGNALSIKHTGLGTPAMIALEGKWLCGLYFPCAFYLSQHHPQRLHRHHVNRSLAPSLARSLALQVDWVCFS